MAIANNIINYLRLSGIVSGGYMGFVYGNRVKDWVCDNSQTMKYYHNQYVLNQFNKSHMSEETLFNLIGCFSGIICGHKFWPIVVPIALYRLSDEYPDEIENIKRLIRD